MKDLKLHRVLVPIDFSPESFQTLRTAKLFVKRFGATLHLVHVVDPPPAFPARRAMLPLAFSETEMAKSAKKRLRELAAKFSLPARANTCLIRTGTPAEEISQAAGAIRADLIAIATRGFTGLKRAFLGSTTERLVRSAPCPVLVVRQKEKESSTVGPGRRARTPFQTRKILVPLDFSDGSRVGLDYALRFARQFRSRLVLFHSVFVHTFALSDEYTALAVPDIMAHQKDYARDEMQKLRDALSRENLRIETEIAVGRPVEQIGNYVEKMDINLIITSTHGRSGLGRVFIGSTAEHIVRYASCPVLVVPNLSLRENRGQRN